MVQFYVRARRFFIRLGTKVEFFGLGSRIVKRVGTKGLAFG